MHPSFRLLYSVTLFALFIFASRFVLRSEEVWAARPPSLAINSNLNEIAPQAPVTTTTMGRTMAVSTTAVITNSSALSTTYDGTPVGYTPTGFPYRGNPNAAITLVEYSDYLCPFCGRHFQQTLPTLVEKYIKTGQAQLIFHDFPIASLHPTAPPGHYAALCVAEQGATHFWQMHDELFRRQAQWNSLPNPSDFLRTLAKEIGADLTVYDSCMASQRTVRQVEERIADGQKSGFNGTPSFVFINNRTQMSYTLVGAMPVETFTQWFDALLAGKEPPKEPEPAKPELPFWAKTEGLAPDPERPGYTLAGDQFKGNPQAKVVVVEFSNFQCPSCQEHALNVQPAIDKALVDNDQILWVFKNLPLRSLPQSMVAAAAGECAGDQGKFWEMHDLLFKTQTQWAVDKPDPALLSLAKQLNLDNDQFGACFSGRQALERVVNDLFDAQDVVNTTPTFIVLSAGQGSVMRGSRPADQFIATLQGIVKTANVQP